MDNYDELCVNDRLDSSIAKINLNSDIITDTTENDVSGDLAKRLDKLDLEEQNEVELRLAGRVHAVVALYETLVVQLAEVLAEGTPVFAEDRRELGSVDHVFGPITEPMCSLRLTSPSIPAVGAMLYYRRDHPRTGIVRLAPGPAGHDYLVSVQSPARP